jgi:hypothetical protein
MNLGILIATAACAAAAFTAQAQQPLLPGAANLHARVPVLPYASASADYKPDRPLESANWTDVTMPEPGSNQPNTEESSGGRRH